jgi:hypothetical protein
VPSTERDPFGAGKITGMDELALEPPVAAEAPATRTALARARLLRDAAGVGGALALVLGAWLLWAGAAPSRSLERDGERTTATVTAVAPQRVNGGGNERGRVTFAFDLAGEARTVTNDVGGTILHYSVGQSVEVLVPPGDPDGARMVGELDRPGWELPGAPMAALGLVALVWGGVRSRALRRASRRLGAEPWLAVRAAVDQLAVEGFNGTRALGVVALSREPGDPSVVVTSRGLRRLAPDLEPVAWVVGWGTDELVVSPPGGGRPLEVRSVIRRVRHRARGGTTH